MDSIYQQTSSIQYSSNAKSQSVSQIKSAVSKCSSSVAQIAKFQLQLYKDINDNQFQLIPPEKNPERKSFVSQYTSYMNYHFTYVPIGPNYQANIPPIMLYQKYQKKSSQKLRCIHKRKIHDPEKDSKFYKSNRQLIENIFGVGKSYEDVIELKNCFDKKTQFNSFREYLQNEQVIQQWQEYFATKQKLSNKSKKKKKRLR